MNALFRRIGGAMVPAMDNPDPGASIAPQRAMLGWSTDLTPAMDAAIDAELANAPPLTEERVRALLAASGVHVMPRRS